jgi:plasmid stabilization system protein ParE
MRTLPVFFTGLAEEDLDQLEDYISARDPAAAARVRIAIVQQSLRLGKAPGKGMVLTEPQSEQEIGVRTAIVQQSLRLGKAPGKGMVLTEPQSEQEIGVRLWPVARYRNYLILYRVEPEQIRVLRILNAAQDWTRFFRQD